MTKQHTDIHLYTHIHSRIQTLAYTHTFKLIHVHIHFYTYTHSHMSYRLSFKHSYLQTLSISFSLTHIHTQKNTHTHTHSHILTFSHLPHFLHFTFELKELSFEKSFHYGIYPLVFLSSKRGWLSIKEGVTNGLFFVTNQVFCVTKESDENEAFDFLFQLASLRCIVKRHLRILLWKKWI